MGGAKISEPAADLACVMALASAAQNKPLPRKLAVFGEVGLAGEVRAVPGIVSVLPRSAGWGSRMCWCPHPQRAWGRCPMG